MTLLLPPAAIRELDARAIKDFGVPGIILMENAGRGCAEFIANMQPEGKVVICCGKGNNGGDGLVIARHLDQLKIPFEVILFACPSEMSGDALTNFEIVANSNMPMTIRMNFNSTSPEWRQNLTAKMEAAGLIVDALLGTGSTGEPRSPLDTVINLINAANKPVIAIDLPSGLDAANGVPAKATIRATQTLTFVAQKTGFASAAARACLGQVHVLDIGAPRVLVEAIMRENPPAPNA
jgi:NAD(P)H-hydrate epimerase